MSVSCSGLAWVDDGTKSRVLMLPPRGRDRLAFETQALESGFVDFEAEDAVDEGEEGVDAWTTLGEHYNVACFDGRG